MLETQRIFIRPVEERDYPALLNIYQEAKNMQFILSGRSDWTMSELRDKWNCDKYDAATKTGFWIVEEKSTKQIIGECGLLKNKSPITESLELAYLLDVKYWGKGLGTELCQCLLQYGFEKLKLQRIAASMYKLYI